MENMTTDYIDCVELADMVRNQPRGLLRFLSEWTYNAFMNYKCVIAGDNLQERFEEPLVAIFLAGYYTGLETVTEQSESGVVIHGNG